MTKRKPFIVEFTGTPEAGKTSTLKLLYKKLSKLGYKVKVYPESAENTPNFFPKGSLEISLWRNFDIAKHLLEAQFLSDYDIVLFDRGAFDGIFWIYLHSIYNANIATKTASFEKFFKRYPPKLLIAFYVSADESIKRRGGEGNLVTKQFVSTYNHLLDTFIGSLKEVNKELIFTDNKTIEEVCQITQNSILEHLKSHS